MVCGTFQGDVLDLLALPGGEFRWSATGVVRVQRVEPVGGEVVQHVADPVRACEDDLGYRDDVQAPCGEQYHLCSAPGDYRTVPAAAHDLQQTGLLVVINCSDLHRA